MKAILSSYFGGLIFAIGLGIGGMTQPQKILAFLDVFGKWDPSLAFVMAGALVVHFVLFRLIVKRKSPRFASDFQIPSRTDIDQRLFIGAAIFGIGWGLGGYCPAPAITALASLSEKPLIFVVSMIGGMLASKFVSSKIPAKTV